MKKANSPKRTKGHLRKPQRKITNEAEIYIDRIFRIVEILQANRKAANRKAANRKAANRKAI